jgi:hypothetical protein
MTCPNRKKWLVKYGWCAHFQNSRHYFTIGWTAFAVDDELKVDNKLLFTITSPFNIIVKVFGIAEAVWSANDKVDKDDFDNDTKEEDIVDDEDYKQKDEDDEDDDDDKVVKLASKNEKHFYQEDDPIVLISSNKNKDDEVYPRARPHGCINTSTEKVS